MQNTLVFYYGSSLEIQIQTLPNVFDNLKKWFIENSNGFSMQLGSSMWAGYHIKEGKNQVITINNNDYCQAIIDTALIDYIHIHKASRIIHIYFDFAL